MAFIEGGNDGTLNGVNEVTIVAAPAAATRRLVKTISISNVDTAAVVVEVRLKETANLRVIWEGTLDVKDTLVVYEPIILDTVDKSITALMAGAAATTNPDFTASWGDAS